MATARECFQVLAMLAELDRREYDETTAKAWAWILGDIPAEDLQRIAFEGVKRDDGYVDPKYISGQWEREKARARSFVRSAKLRGMIPQDWPADRPVPAAVKARLVEEAKHNLSADLVPTAQVGPVHPGVVRALPKMKRPEDA